MSEPIDLDPKYYAQHSAFQAEIAQEVMARLTLLGKERILDLGCGDGKLSAQLAAQAQNVVGVDLSPAMIAYAKQTHVRSNLEFLCGDAASPEVAGLFDIIVCFNAFHWFADGARVLLSMFKLLKPGGEALIVAYPKESPYLAVLERTLARPQWADYQALSAARTMLTTEEIKQAALEAGFHIKECQSDLGVAHYESYEAFQDYVRGWLASYVPLPYEKQQTFLEQACVLTQVPYLKATFHLVR